MTQSTIRFDLQAHLQSGLERMEGFKEELQAALGALSVRLRGDREQWSLEMEPEEEDVPVALLDLLDDLPALHGLTAVLGVAVDDRPVLIDLATANAAHVLVAGDAQAGKSSLLRTIAVSLALTRRQSEVQLLLFDGGAAADDTPSLRFRPLEYLPHVLGPAIDTVEEAQEVLAFLAHEASFRREQRVRDPAILILIDDVEALARAAPPTVTESLATLLQEGAAAGVHLVVSAESSLRPVLGSLLDARLPVRLVGWVADRDAAREAAGMANSQAENLYGAGDFVAVSQDQVTNFQAAYVSDYDLHYVLDQLHRRPGRPLLARPFDPRPHSAPAAMTTDHSFVFDAVRHVVDLEDLPPRRREVRRTIEMEMKSGAVVPEPDRRQDEGETKNGFVGRRPTLYATGRAPDVRASRRRSPNAAGRAVQPRSGELESAVVSKETASGGAVPAGGEQGPQPGVEMDDRAPESTEERGVAASSDVDQTLESPAAAELEYVDVDDTAFPDPDDDEVEEPEPEPRTAHFSSRPRPAPRPRPRAAPRRSGRTRVPAPGTDGDDDTIPFE